LEDNYAECVLAQNRINIKFNDIPSLTNQYLWADQADNRTAFPQSNVFSNQNKETTPDSATQHITNINFTTTPTNLEPSAIPYQANQSVDPMLWNGNFSSISLFSTVKVLERDAKNIACSL